MRKEKRLLELNNKGASLVTVIIAIAFVSILVGVVMMTSMVNYKMKRVNAYAKDTFYSAEQVLDEINIGLQRMISDSMSMAYMDVMEEYGRYSVEEKSKILQTNYYESMWGKLEVAGTGHSKYRTETLRELLKSSTDWNGDPEGGYGAVVRAVDESGNLTQSGTMITYDTGIILKDLRVYYKDSKGFVSVIQTDIRLTYPDFDFATTTTLPDVASYGFVADNGVFFDGVSEVNLEGNFYGDSWSNINASNVTTKVINHVGEGKVISKHDIVLDNAALNSSEDSVVWAEEIETIGGDLNLRGETLVADDLNINGKKSNVVVSGIYNGFGNSGSDADKSSAILVNGSDSYIDFSGVERLTLAGHGYIGAARPNIVDNAIPATEERNIYTGESIAVKSNQMMYLVPSECIGVNEGGRSLYNKNPLTETEYQKLQEALEAVDSTYTEVSTTVNVDRLGGKPLASFIKMQEVGGERIAQPEKVFVTTNDETLVYYYMQFASEELANEYFTTYYETNKSVYDRYASNYVDFLKLPQGNATTTIRVAANGIVGDDATEYELYETDITNASVLLSDNQAQYDDRFKALCMRLTEDYTLATTTATRSDIENPILYENLVDDTELASYITVANAVNGVPGNEVAYIDSSMGKVLLINSPNEYTIGSAPEDSDVHLVIASGDVKVGVPNFEGTIIANGKVTVLGAVQSIKVNESLVNALLRTTITHNGQEIPVANILRDGKDYMLAVLDYNDEDKFVTTLADLVVYENWKKE